MILAHPFSAPKPTPKTDDEILAVLISLQTFEGYWDPSPELFAAIGISEAGAEEQSRGSGAEQKV